MKSKTKTITVIAKSRFNGKRGPDLSVRVPISFEEFRAISSLGMLDSEAKTPTLHLSRGNNCAHENAKLRKDIGIIQDAVRDWRAGKLSDGACIFVIAAFVFPHQPTKDDIEWGKRVAARHAVATGAPR